MIIDQSQKLKNTIFTSFFHSTRIRLFLPCVSYKSYIYHWIAKSQIIPNVDILHKSEGGGKQEGRKLKQKLLQLESERMNLFTYIEWILYL